MRCVARSLVTLTCWLLLTAPLLGVSSPQQEPQKPKAPRVWTNEDLQGLKGGINVVGQPDEKTPSPKPQAGNAADDKAPTELCESDGWADAIAAVVAVQGVPLDSKFWKTRQFSNLCSSGIKAEAVGPRITGDYTLDSSKKVHLKADVILRSLPTAAAMVATVAEQRSFIISWKGQPYVTNRVDYVDNVYNGVSMYTIQKLYLTNAMTHKPLLFEPTAANLKEIDASLQITVTILP